MEQRKNLCAMIPESLHAKVRKEQESLDMKLAEYVEKNKYFERGEQEMAQETRTLAFQISEELFLRLKEHLKRIGMSQKKFVIGLIEQALQESETEGQEEV